MLFLYKLRPGDCPESFGLAVAAMANLPPSVIQRAEFMSAQLETMTMHKMVARQGKTKHLVQLLTNSRTRKEVLGVLEQLT